MDSTAELFLERASNELRLAESLLNLSEKEDIKEALGAYKEDTFYSAAISHAYYSIFYAAKAILLAKGIKTSSPEVHRKTYEEFKRVLVDTGELDVGLLEAYKKMIIRADTLLEIFKDEKWKRGNYTYETIPQANKEPARDSKENAKTFLKHITTYLQE